MRLENILEEKKEWQNKLSDMERAKKKGDKEYSKALQKVYDAYHTFFPLFVTPLSSDSTCCAQATNYQAEH